MMDLVVCEAPLDNSFQKERLELVNKGSLGRRRKPSRANIKLILSPSQNGQHQPAASTPVSVSKKALVNGDVGKKSCSQHKCKTISSTQFQSTDANLDETMLYHRKAENSPKYVREHGKFGCERKILEPEPEWISLSRKLCAKFVEGHIENHSVDSYNYEESNGATPKHSPSTNGIEQVNSPPKPTQTFQPQQFREEKKVVIEASVLEKPSEEPPWIPLSRKLRTKFIEEHIEYPIPACVEAVRNADIVEPNGDIRIIEKIGRPKSKKSRIRKEPQPEWISLSKKLRAKFIESHIDDPDTIALDNQLNASDPEETSSESLSDISQEIPDEREHELSPTVKYGGKKSQIQNEIIRSIPTSESKIQSIEQNSVFFPEKECCWEYQEMEFDQESSSGTFQDAEYIDEAMSKTGKLSQQEIKIMSHSSAAEMANHFASEEKEIAKRITFADFEKSQSYQTVQCYNNDVHFTTRFDQSTEPPSKLITVKIVSRPERKLHEEETKTAVNECSVKRDINGSFFNLSTWEEAHYKSDEESSEVNPSEFSDASRKDMRSKSVDNLCDSIQDTYLENECNVIKRADEPCLKFKSNTPLKGKPFFGSENVLNKIDSKDFHKNSLSDLNSHGSLKDISENSSNIFLRNENCCNKEDKNVHRIEIQSSHSSESIASSDDRCSKTVNLSNSAAKNKKSGKKESFKCNGVIPNSVCNNVSSSCQTPENSKFILKEDSQFSNSNSDIMGISHSKRVVYKNEYANISVQLAENPNNRETPFEQQSSNLSKDLKSPASEFEDKSCKGANGNTSKDNHQQTKNSLLKAGEFRFSNNGISCASQIQDDDPNERIKFKTTGNVQMICKSKSLCDISENRRGIGSEDAVSSKSNDTSKLDFEDKPYLIVEAKNTPAVDFQHFEFESEVPLCAKLVSKHNNKHSVKSAQSVSSSSNMNGSVCSESSHVYEDMFKETTSCPSDSETSSWTVMKNNTYYVNGRSSSLNDLDLSDSCSLSVKCDYASSCSGQSTLQSRHSSCGSSSFYVNLKDYDSHMLEPSIGRKKNRKVSTNGHTHITTKSNPPTPESLRHLFTSPLHSIHTPPIISSRLVNRLPPETQSHCYSATTATSSAFKHGFDLAPQKPKKSERSSSIKIKDIAHGIILTFRRFQNHSKSSHLSQMQYVDVSHLAENGCRTNNSVQPGKMKSKKDPKEIIKVQEKGRNRWGLSSSENGKTDSDSGCNLSSKDFQSSKPRRSSSDLTGSKSNLDLINRDIITEKKKNKNNKKSSNNREKGKKSRSKSLDPRAVPTVSRKVQQMADGTLCLVTTVSGDTTLPGVYSDSPDTSSELSSHKPVKLPGESNC
ncbi:uncharacterized protein LOC118192931 isoform X2 [Stegodyphus dumicola]|uniref:uncharacterized protein LOC118192931 isoform X2 n=1 Tax=Stegodyphus dumicola TaxID=202533 RepID=UPI0015AC8B59|nr:uncharacterized protein LOC118192931 isoform X2 [Stegodyphus dumicola]